MSVHRWVAPVLVLVGVVLLAAGAVTAQTPVWTSWPGTTLRLLDVAVVAVGLYLLGGRLGARGPAGGARAGAAGDRRRVGVRRRACRGARRAARGARRACRGARRAARGA